jgi:hypothetical protein
MKTTEKIVENTFGLYVYTFLLLSDLNTIYCLYCNM